MDKYEYKVRAEQIMKLVEENEFEAAANISDTIDWRRVRSVNMLTTVGEVYERSGRYQDAKEILLMAYERAPIGRRLAYRLTEVCIRMDDLEEAQSYYEDFVSLSPNDNRKYELLYEMNKRQGAPTEMLIAVLEEYKRNDMDERWAYELALNYEKAGMTGRLIDQCDEIFLWFGDGEYVLKALELKERYAPLTAEQQAVKLAASEKKAEKPEETERPKTADSNRAADNIKTVDSHRVAESNKILKAAETEKSNKGFEPAEGGGEQPELYPAVKPFGGVTRDLRKEQGIIRRNFVVEEKETKNDEQIEGQLTLEEVLADYERNNGWGNSDPQAGIELKAVPAYMQEVKTEQSAYDIKADKETEDRQKASLVSEKTTEQEQSAEAEKTAEQEQTVEAEKTAEQEQSAEAEKIAEQEQPAEAEKVAEQEQSTEAGKAAEQEQSTEAEKTAEQERTDVSEGAVAQEQAELPDIESAEADTDALFATHEEYDDGYVDSISEAMAKTADELMADETTGNVMEGELTEEQRTVFEKFLFMRGMEEQLKTVFQDVAAHTEKDNRSVEGNLLVVGEYKSGKTTLAISVMREINRLRNRKGRRIAKISGERLNYKGLRETFSHLQDADLLVEHAGRMSKATLQGLLRFMNGETGGMLVVFEDTKEGMEYILTQVPEARTYFNYYIELREVEIAEWVKLAGQYCREHNFRIDDMAKLALSASIAKLYQDSPIIEFADVQDILDEAMKKYKRRHIFKRNRKGAEDGTYLVLKEADFK